MGLVEIRPGRRIWVETHQVSEKTPAETLVILVHGSCARLEQVVILYPILLWCRLHFSGSHARHACPWGACFSACQVLLVDTCNLADDSKHCWRFHQHAAPLKSSVFSLPTAVMCSMQHKCSHCFMLAVTHLPLTTWAAAGVRSPTNT